VLVSVVVATRNRAASLREALASLAAQSLPDGVCLEIVVADNGSTDDTQRVVADVQRDGPWPLRVVYQPTPGKPYALNAALEQAEGEILAFFDDDQVAAADWIAQLLACFARHPGAAGVGGPALLDPRDARGWWGEALSRPFCGSVPPGDTPAQALRGGNMALRTEVVRRAGGFDPRFRRGQDGELTRRVSQAGYLLETTSLAVIYHRVPRSRQTLRQFCRQYVRHGGSRGLMGVVQARSRQELHLLRREALHGAVVCARDLLLALAKRQAPAAVQEFGNTVFWIACWARTYSRASTPPTAVQPPVDHGDASPAPGPSEDADAG